jgi:threonine synthase
LPVEIHLKLEFLFPSGSYKDRGATTLVTQAQALGLRQVVEDSSGNAGAAIAAYCGRAGLACDIYVPASVSAAKLAQIESYGARLVRVPGSREDTARAAMEAVTGKGAATPGSPYYASHSWNPFFFTGTKTFAYEVCEQLGWRAPDAVLLPTGNGTLLLGAARGFRELRAGGVIPRPPRLIAVQSEACAPLYQAFQGDAAEVGPAEIGKLGNREIRKLGSVSPASQPSFPVSPASQPSFPPTIASGIAIAEPIRLAQMVETLRAEGGAVITVTDEDLRAARAALARRGLYIEPTGAAAAAAVGPALAQGLIEPGQTVIVPLTGSGLKASG